MKPTMMGQSGDEAAVAKALGQDLPPLFDYLESQIDGEFLVGNAFSIADISVVAGFYNFELAEERIDAARWPKLAAYVQAITARPSFAAAVAARKE